MEGEYPPSVEEFTQGPEPTGFARWSELIVAGIIIVAAITILWLARDFRVPPGVRISPKVFPQLVGAGMLLVGVWYVVDIIRVPNVLSAGEDSEDVDIDAEADWVTLIFVGIGLTAFALLVEPAGFAIAAATMFAICSTAMGSKKLVLNILIGLALGLAVFFTFDYWLGVRLPNGWLEYLDL